MSTQMDVSHKVLAQCQREKPSFQDFLRDIWIGIIQVLFAKVEKKFVPSQCDSVQCDRTLTEPISLGWPAMRFTAGFI